MEDFDEDLIEVQRLNTRNLHTLAKIKLEKDREIAEEKAAIEKQAEVKERHELQNQYLIESAERQRRDAEVERKRCEEITNSGNMAACMAACMGGSC